VERVEDDVEIIQSEDQKADASALYFADRCDTTRPIHRKLGPDDWIRCKVHLKTGWSRWR
jgi:hypothetical protein